VVFKIFLRHRYLLVKNEQAIYKSRRVGGSHPASLNFGDCSAYALAKVTGARLLFNGNDFGQTDIQLVALNR
jgi:ribonuclease VapC